jgi:MoaA/NifB/PqqE/SkfB family radical SAM enzyme
MAIGISGSNGGITDNAKPIAADEVAERPRRHRGGPAEVSYFVNNVCNLRCRHCYVGYNERRGSLSVDEWTDVFDDLLRGGARTFGNVGKEPMLSWSTTCGLLEYFASRREECGELRFGLVTNLTLMKDGHVADLLRVHPDYIDVSLDGDERVHDSIRGSGTFAKTLSNLSVLVETGLAERVFISFTLNSENLHTVPSLVRTLNEIGITQLMISPYASLAVNDPLLLSCETATRWVCDVLRGQVIDFHACRQMKLFFKNDYSTSRELMEAWVQAGIIRLDQLLIDEYGVVFCKYDVRDAVAYFNYQMCNDFPWRAIRISHDGHVSTCLDMFYEDYRPRAVGNVRRLPVLDVISNGRAACCV